VKSDRFRQNLIRYYSFYTGGFIAFVLLLAIAEAVGLPKRWVGYCFLIATFMLKRNIMLPAEKCPRYLTAWRRRRTG
jgi:cation/acetate symporter